MLVMKLSLVCRVVLAVWFAFLVSVIAFVSGEAAWIWFAFGPGAG